MSNFSVYTRLLPLFVPPGETANTSTPLSSNAVAGFSFVLRRTERSQGREVAVVDFTPRSGNAKAAKGTLFIDTRTAGLYRTEKDMPQNGMFNSSNPQIQIGDNSLRIVTDYSPYNDSLTRVASTQVVSSLRLVVKGVSHETSTTSYFFVYEYGPPTPGEKYKDTKESVVDLAQIRRRRYRPDFWRDNAVIKDSPIEEGIIRDFEGKKVFGKLN